MYDIYIGSMLLPVAPGKIQVKVNNKNKTLTLINEGEINILKKAGLTDISMEILLPNVWYPWAQYWGGFRNANFYLRILEMYKASRRPVMFKVIRKMPRGRFLFFTNMCVSIEDYQPVDDKKEGFDVTVAIKMKQYRFYGTKFCKVEEPEEESEETAVDEPVEQRETENSPEPKEENKTYSVQQGDCLWNIAKQYYGDGSKWEEIYKANTNVCGEPYVENGVTYCMIRAGDQLVIPPLS